MRKNILKHKIASAGQKQLEARQIAQRLQELLPSRLADIARSRRGNSSVAKSTLLALQDPNYLAYLDELVEVNRQAREHRILWETRSMLLKAWQSVEAYHRPS